jgi:pimeloyl-ACP methyl ester carboxylesterase
MAEQESYCPVEVALLPGVKHSPQREAPEATLKVVADFARRALNESAPGSFPAASI